MTSTVTRDQAKKAVQGDFRGDDPAKDLAEAQAELARAEVTGRREFFTLRRKWSDVIIIWIWLLIVFNVLLTVAVGKGTLDFTEYQWFVTAVTIETFLQIVGLGYVAVRYLFSDGRGNQG